MQGKPILFMAIIVTVLMLTLNVGLCYLGWQIHPVVGILVALSFFGAKR